MQRELKHPDSWQSVEILEGFSSIYCFLKTPKMEVNMDSMRTHLGEICVKRGGRESKVYLCASGEFTDQDNRATQAQESHQKGSDQDHEGATRREAIQC